jgi:cytochrome P450
VRRDPGSPASGWARQRRNRAARSIRIAASALTDDRISSIIAQVWVAGQDTVTSPVGLGTLALLRNRKQFALLQRGAVVSYAVEVMLRCDAPVQLTHRFATQHLELDGVSLEACEGHCFRPTGAFD